MTSVTALIGASCFTLLLGGAISARAASPGLETIYSEGKVDVYWQKDGKTRPVGARDGRRAIDRGDLVSCGPGARVAIGIGGHTVVKASPATVLAVLPASVAKDGSGRRVEVIFLFLGEVKVTTNWDRAPKKLRVKVSTSSRSYSTDLGPVTLREAPPAVPPTEDAKVKYQVDVEKALQVARDPIPFTDSLHAPAPPPDLLEGFRRRRKPTPAAR